MKSTFPCEQSPDCSSKKWEWQLPFQAGSRFILSLLLVFIFSSGLKAQITIDGNPADWPAVLNNAIYTQKAFRQDVNGYNFGDSHKDDGYTQGTSNNLPIESWRWVFGNTNDKGDIENAGAVLIGTNLYFFGDRSAFNGTAELGFWFLLDDVSQAGDGSTPGSPFTGTHRDGDLLILNTFTSGGGAATPKVFVWRINATYPAPGALVDITSTTTATSKTNELTTYPAPGGTSGTIINIPAPGGAPGSSQLWRFTSKKVGNTNTDDGTYYPPLFFEGNVDLATIPGASTCFQSFIMKTTTSANNTAANVDLVAGSFSGIPPRPVVVGDEKCFGFDATATATCTGSTARWYTTTGTFIQEGSSLTLPAGTAAGTYNYNVTCITAQGCESAPRPVSIIINPTPAVDGLVTIAPGITLVSDDEYSMKIARTFTANLTASGSSGTAPYTYTWQQLNTGGNTSFAPTTATSNGNATFTIIQPVGLADFYDFRVTIVDAKGCTSTDDVRIRIDRSAPVCVVNGPETVCAGSTGNVYSHPTALDPDNIYTWTFSTTNGSTIVGGSPQVGVSSVTVNAGATAGSYTVTLSIVSVTGINGVGSPCAKTVTVDPIPSCSIAGPDPVCSGSTGNTYTSTVLPAGGTVTHSWSITGNGTITSALNGASITVTAGASGTYTVRDEITRNGCVSFCTKIVTVNPIPSCSIAGPDPVCGGSTGNTYTSTVLPAGGTVTHSWSITGSGTITSALNGASITVTAGASGTYTVRDEITRNGCVSFCTKTVTVNPIPSCDIAGPDPVCGGSTGNTYTSTVLPAGGTVTHNWSITGSGTITSALNGASITVTAGASGTYTVRDEITRNGCVSFCTKTVTVNPIPSCSIAGPDPVCSGSTGNTYTSTVLPAGGTVTHSWSITGNGTITSALNGASITVTAGASGTYTVRDEITRNGCVSFCTKTVTVNPIPSCSIAGPDPVCGGSTGNTYTSTVLPAGGTVTHNWSITGDGTITSALNGASITVTAGASGTYTVRDEITRNGCVSFCTKTVTVNPIPSCSIAGPDPVCGGSTGNTYTSTVLPAGGTVTHNWSITGSGTITSALNGASITVTAGASGTYTVRDEITRNGCVSFCTKTVTVNPIPSCSIAGPDPVCGGSTGNTYTSTVLPAGGTVTHSWSITGSGTITSALNGASITVTAGASGTYTVRDEITRNGCVSFCTKTVTVNPIPSCSIAGPDPVCSGSTGNTYTSTVLPAGGTVTHSWSITGNGTITSALNGASITVTAGASGTYTVRDEITRNGCVSFCTKTVTVTKVDLSLQKTDVTCNAGTNGSITATFSGGTSPYTATLNGVAQGTVTSGKVFSGLAASVVPYTVVITDANGCMATETIIVDEPPLLTCSLTAPATLACGSSGTVSGTVVGGTAIYTCSAAFDATATAGGWVVTNCSVTGTGISVSYTSGLNVLSGVLTVTVTDANGCTTTCTVTIACTGGQACSPGFWRNQTQYWDQLSDVAVNNMPGALAPGGKFITTTNFWTYFNIPVGQCGVSTNASLTMAQAMINTNLTGDCKSLVFHGISNLLSAALLPGTYPFPAGSGGNFSGLYTQIRNALVSCNCGPLASTLGAISALHTGTYCQDAANALNTFASENRSPRIAEDDGGIVMNAFPNPYNSVVNFRFASPTTGKAALEVYDILGRRLAIVYQGDVNADIPVNVKYNVPVLNRVTLFYRLTVDGKTVRGTILPDRD